MSFVHLHVHSEFSLSSSLVRMDELIRQADRMGMPAVAVTDRANLYGSLYLWKTAKEECEGRVKPIYGAELGVVVDGGGDFPRHLIVLAENQEGFKNLSRLVTLAHCEYGFDGTTLRPRIPLTKVFEHKEGLIVLTAGLKGVINSFLIQDQEQIALQTLQSMKAAFGEKNLFLELQDSSLTPQVRANQRLVDFAKREGLGLVATSDVHYMKPEDAFAQEVWMMVAHKMNLEENPTSRLAPREYYFRSPEEMREAFSHTPEACDNTLAIAERCNVKLKFKDNEGKRIFHLPDFSMEGLDEKELFATEAKKGLAARLELLGITDEAQQKIYWERLDYEVSTIQKMGFSGYYLIVSDFIRWAKAHDIPVGPGRGSGAGSLAAYVLDITDLDPIEHGLLFERFLNPERVSLPDFDVDFCQERRHEVIKYVSEKYGKDRVCQIITYAKEQSKNALKDVGRVIGMSFGETNRLTKLIPSVQMKPLTIDETLEQVDEMRQLVESDPKVKQCVDLALRIEGSLRQPGVHAAGVIIASRPVAEIAPMSRDVNGGYITQWDMKMSEEAGLVKFDFLGLVTLDLMYLATRWVRKIASDKLEVPIDENFRVSPDDLAKVGDKKVENYDARALTLTYANIPAHDPRAYELMSKGDTLGVFQLESSGMQNLCTRIKPDRFADIAAINALFRPGPLESGMVDDYINRKHGKTKVEVMFPEMMEVLKETYGVIIYQEQVQQIARVVSGYSLGGADLLRRAMGKKNVKEMEKQRATFVEGAVKAGKPADKAGELFDLIEKFAGYGFNKSHAAAYALLAVQTAYLKAVHPTEFFTALLTIEKEDTDRLSRYIADARNRGIKILPPDVNESDMDFSIVGDGVIRFGLSAIKNVGESAVEAILEARKKSVPFRDLFDFVDRVDSKRINRRSVEALIQAGAFDSLEEEKIALRGKYLATAEKALEWATKQALQREMGQFSLFGEPVAGQNDATRPAYELNYTAPTQRQLLDWEKELLGIFVSGSPLDKFMDRAKQAGCVPIFSLAETGPKDVITIAGIVSELREVRVKKGRRAGELMAILKFEDATGQVEMVSFPDHYKEFSGLLKSNKPLIVRAELDFEDEKPKLIGGDVSLRGRLCVEDLAEVEEKWPRKIRVDIALNRLEGAISPELLYMEIARVLKKYPGPVPVELKIFKSGVFSTQLELGAAYTVHPVADLLQELSQMVAIPGSLRVETVH